ncbi:MAG: zinc metallopeptidase [Clostridia bacterium]|nr:zinc metallopeptidase [Clostridia bacterium]
MLNLIIAIVLILILLTLKLILRINFKELKELETNKKLEKITNKFPENLVICKNILKKLNNESVKVEEDKQSKTSLYIAVSNKIIISNLKNSYARIQTIAHECIHSIQNKNLLLFNFVISNIYLIYYAISIILTILGVFGNSFLQIIILLLLSFIYYIVRSFLETEAMIKAEYIAKEYIEENDFCTKEEKEELINEYKKINKVGVITYNYILFGNCIVKVITYCIVALILFLIR